MPTALDLDALPYRRGACVGSGGGGEVFAAWDGDDRQVALKVAFGADDLTAARFAREIANAGLLPARYVPRVFDHGRLADGRPWLAMEWLGGGTLGQRLDAAPWSVAATAALGAAVARALAAAHAVGVVHRDVKPDNIMFRADGEVVLVDLGLARADDDPASSATRCAGTPVATRWACCSTGCGPAAIRSPAARSRSSSRTSARSRRRCRRRPSPAPPRWPR